MLTALLAAVASARDAAPPEDRAAAGSTEPIAPSTESRPDDPPPPLEGGRPFARLSSDHFVVYFESDHAGAARRAAVLEATRRRFIDAFTAMGFDLHPVEARLPCVIFEGREGFETYARLADRVEMGWSRGYYSARTNRVAVFDEAFEARDKPATPENASLTRAPEARPPAGLDPARLVLRTAAPPAADGWDAETPRLSALDAAKLSHEAAHQLSFNTGLQKRGVLYPFWVSEGLATGFEDGGKPFTGELPKDGRRTALVSAAKRGLLPLVDFVALTRLPVSDETAVSDLYSQAWAFFRFLYVARPVMLRDYMKTLAAAESGFREESELFRDFTEAFGEPASLEDEWRGYVAHVCDSSGSR